MNKVYSGKTKDIYSTASPKEFLFLYKDTMLGENGKYDAGGNIVIGTEKGKGKITCYTVQTLFKSLKDIGIKNHFIKQIADNKIIFKKAQKIPLEIICRNFAWGSFTYRYPSLFTKGQNLFGLIEFTVKDDKKKDPLITEEALILSKLIDTKTIITIRNLIGRLNSHLKDYLLQMGLILIDFKTEFGFADNELILIDELSCDTMRIGKFISKRGLEVLDLYSYDISPDKISIIDFKDFYRYIY